MLDQEYTYDTLFDKLSSVIGNEPAKPLERMILDLHTTFFFPFDFIFSLKHMRVKCTMGPCFLWSMTFSGVSLFACVFFLFVMYYLHHVEVKLSDLCI